MTSNKATGNGVTAVCANCRHFRNDAMFMEDAIPGLKCLSSGYASVRADDGICLMHGRLTGIRSGCRDFAVGEG
jgi:hypothetical protein